MTVPLIIFVAVVIGDVLALVVDVFLKAWGYKTISKHCWEHPVLAVYLVAFQVIGALALWVHLAVP